MNVFLKVSKFADFNNNLVTENVWTTALMLWVRSDAYKNYFSLQKFL